MMLFCEELSAVWRGTVTGWREFRDERKRACTIVIRVLGKGCFAIEGECPDRV